MRVAALVLLGILSSDLVVGRRDRINIQALREKLAAAGPPEGLSEAPLGESGASAGIVENLQLHEGNRSSADIRAIGTSSGTAASSEGIDASSGTADGGGEALLADGSTVGADDVASLPRSPRSDTHGSPVELALNSSVENASELGEGDGVVCVRGPQDYLYLPVVSQHVWGAHPQVYDVAMPVSVIAAVLLLFFSVPHLWRLAHVNCPQDLRAWWFQTYVVASTPAVMGTFQLFRIFVPRSWKEMDVVSTGYEALAFLCFKQLIFNLLCGSDNWTTNKALAILSRQDPLPQMWASFPLGCCFKPCAKRRPPGQGDLNVMEVLMWQFVIIQPTVSVLKMLEMRSALADNIAIVSTLTAVYCLTVLMDAADQTLEEIECRKKFAVIRGIFLLSNLVLNIISNYFPIEDEQIGRYCYNEDTIAAAYSGLIVIVMALPLSLRSRYEFKPEELERKILPAAYNDVAKAAASYVTEGRPTGLPIGATEDALVVEDEPSKDAA